MSDYPKYFEKNGKQKKVANVRQQVEAEFAGYREVRVDADVKPTSQEPPASHVARVNALLGQTDEVKSPPELTEAEMAKLPEAKTAEVVDKTEDTPKPAAPKRGN